MNRKRKIHLAVTTGIVMNHSREQHVKQTASGFPCVAAAAMNPQWARAGDSFSRQLGHCVRSAGTCRPQCRHWRSECGINHHGSTGHEWYFLKFERSFCSEVRQSRQ